MFGTDPDRLNVRCRCIGDDRQPYEVLAREEHDV
jgi:hypothetical protein